MLTYLRSECTTFALAEVSWPKSQKKGGGNEMEKEKSGEDLSYTTFKGLSAQSHNNYSGTNVRIVLNNLHHN